VMTPAASVTPTSATTLPVTAPPCDKPQFVIEQSLVLEAALGIGLDNDCELIARQRVASRDERVVTVVARVGPQLGSTLIEVANLELRAERESDDREHRRNPIAASAHRRVVK
jgi:hypothetical protein